MEQSQTQITNLIQCNADRVTFPLKLKGAGRSPKQSEDSENHLLVPYVTYGEI